jgi:tRNA pseudouridine38-40 synthase
MKFAACIEYDGTPFYGWQRLSHGPTVQENVERALSQVAAHPVSVVCAGRTDTGVHGIGQVIHFETDAVRPERGWLFGTNAHLPDSVAMRWIQPVADEFHARFSARSRRYRYIILNRAARPALLHKRVCWQQSPLDAHAMHAAAQVLIGEQDFSSFRAAGCQARHAMREIISLQVSRAGDFVYVDIVANAFLHHMVRNIVGSLLKVGAGERPVAWMADLLALRDRTQAGMTAVAAGLYFVHVDYPETFNLPTTFTLPAYAI